MDDLLQEFIAETRETLEALSGEIVAWEASPDDRGRLDAIFRFVHTVKGSCGFLDLPRLERLAHAAEDVLAAVRDGKRTPDRALVTAVLAIVDRIGEIVEAIDAGRALDDSGEDLLVAALAEGADVRDMAQQATITRAPTRSVRLSVDLLDRMMSGMSDMVLARNELSRRLREDGAGPAAEAALERLSATVAEMRDTVTRTRMQRIDALFSALPRMVRDTAAGLGKSVSLVIEGADVELDREMIEMMRDPLVHIVRNSIDHGIESPAERLAAGKREHGRLLVAARQSGNRIIIDIVDDGRGIDTGRIIAKLVANGGDERALHALPEHAKLALVFEPGLSTKDEVTAISGRGVGMDVVRANIEQIGGRIELDSSLGRGLSISIQVPLTLSILSTIVVSAGGQSFAVPRGAIEEIVRVRGEGIRVDRLGDTPVATVRDRRLPYVDLAGILGIADPQGKPNMLAVIGVPGGAFALAVDDVLDSEELVIKPAAPAVMATGVYAGQTLPDSGRPMLLIDCLGVAAAAELVFEREIAAEAPSAAEPENPGTPALLFRDLDGQQRAVHLAVVDRVETVPAGTIRRSAGRDRMAVDGSIVPVASTVPIELGCPAVVLRLTDGSNEIGYAIAEALDIVRVPPTVTPAVAGPVQGVVLLGDEQIELLDPFWLFAHHAAGGARTDAQPLCLIAGESGGWMTNVLRPLVEAAGYRVVAEPPADDPVSVVLTLDAVEAPAAGTAPVLRLSSDPAPQPGHIYRYDRAALLAALERSTNREQAA